MAKTKVQGSSNKEKPWVLQTPSGSSEFLAYRDEGAEPPALVYQVGETQLRHHLRCIEDLHAMVKTHDDWIPLGGAELNHDTQKSLV